MTDILNWSKIENVTAKNAERLLFRNFNGAPVGYGTRDAAHSGGIIHDSLHGLCVVDPQPKKFFQDMFEILGPRFEEFFVLGKPLDEIGENEKLSLVVLQQRVLNKLNGGKWDYAFAGHMAILDEDLKLSYAELAAYEFLAKAFVREAAEELDLELDIGKVFCAGYGPFSQVFENYKGNPYVNFECAHAFIYFMRWAEAMHVWKKVSNKETDGEVAAIKFMVPHEYFKRTKADEEAYFNAMKKGKKYDYQYVPRHPIIDLMKTKYYELVGR